MSTPSPETAERGREHGHERGYERGAGGRKGSHQPGGSLTGRALIAFTVLALLVVALSVPIRNWLSQRAEVAALRADITASTERINELQTELNRWSDPAFVSAEARRRLHFLLPGEIGYVAIARDGSPAESVLSDNAASAPVGWHSIFWDSLQRADGPPLLKDPA